MAGSIRFFPLLSDFEIAALGGSASDAGAMRAAAQLLEGQRVEPPHHLLLQLHPQWSHDLMAKRAAGGAADRILGGFEPAQRTNDITEADFPPLACQTIAAARASDPEEDLVSDQFLQHRLEVAARCSFPLRNLGRAHRPLAAVIGD